MSDRSLRRYHESYRLSRDHSNCWRPFPQTPHLLLLATFPAFQYVHNSPSTTSESVAKVKDAFFPTDRLEWLRPGLSAPSMDVTGSANGLPDAGAGAVMSLSALIAQAWFLQSKVGCI
jgi:hypothetical protein